MAGQVQTFGGRYEMRGELGSGGFATVYRAWDTVLDRDVAIKVLHAHLARDTNVKERFIREGRALARVDHPNVVQVWDCGEADGTAYLSMKLINGRPLEDILKQAGPLPLAEVTSITEQVGAALGAVHAQNLVHRDIKPANILLEEGTGRAMLLDLGVARDLTNATMTGGWIVGTPGFMAPEQVQAGGQVSAQTDVYQLAATVYALLGARPPFEGDTLQVLDAIVRLTPPDLRAARPDLPSGVVAAIGAGMAKDPNQRPWGTVAFAQQLRAAVDAGGTAGIRAPGVVAQATVVAPSSFPVTPRPAPAPVPYAQTPIPGPPAPAETPPRWQSSPRLPRADTPDRPPATAGTSGAKAPLIAGGVVMAAVIIGAIAFFATRSSDSGGNATGTTPATAVVATAPKLAPDETYHQLLATPFNDMVLTGGHTSTGVSAGEPDADDEDFNAIGVVNVGIAGSATEGGAIIYTVFPTPEDAKGRYDQGFTGESNVGLTGTFAPAGFPGPAQGLTATYTDSNNKKNGVSYCIALVGETQVWGVSLLNNSTTRGNNETACALAQSGIAHLQNVQSGH